MECHDQVNRVTESREDFVKWQHNECLHVGYWNKANADIDLFYELRKIWTEAFISAGNPEYHYAFNREVSAQGTHFTHIIKKAA